MVQLLQGADKGAPCSLSGCDCALFIDALHTGNGELTLFENKKSNELGRTAAMRKRFAPQVPSRQLCP